MSAQRPSRTRDDRGAVYIIAVFIVFVMVLTAGLVMDLGRQRTARRDAQALADVIALDMAREADGRTLSKIRSDQGPERLVEAALRNGLDGHIVQSTVGEYPLILRSDEDVQVTVEWGWFSATKEDPCTYVDSKDNPIASMADPIPAGTGWIDRCNQGGDVPNAVLVTATNEIEFMLLPAGGGPSEGGVQRTAIARHGGEELVSFSLGSYLFDGVNAGRLNTLLTRLLGAPVDLQAVHYNGLLSHDLTIRDIASFHGIAGSPDEVLNQQITLQQLATATVDALRRQNNGTLTEAEIQAIEAVFVNSTSTMNGPIRLGDLVMADPTNPESALDADINALDVLQSGVHLAQCTPDSTGNWDCHGVVLDSLVADTDLLVVGAPRTTVIEGQRVYVGNTIGDTLSTSQVSSTVDLDVSLSGQDYCAGLLGLPILCDLTGLLSTLLGSFAHLDIVDVTGSVTIDLVGAKARIADLCYNSPTSRDLDLLAFVSLYDVEARFDVTLMKRDVLGLPLGETTLSLILANSDGDSDGDGTPDTSYPVTFTDPVYMGPEEGLGAGTIGLSGLTVQAEINGSPLGGVEGLQPLWDKLVNGQLQTRVAGITTRLQSLAGRVDTLVGNLSDRLGINLTGADVAGRYVRCGDYGVQLVG